METMNQARTAGAWQGFLLPGAPRGNEKALEAAFESLGRATVHHLISAPPPFGLAQQDRLAALHWLSRRAYARQRGEDLAIVLTLVALGLALAITVLSLYPAAWPGPSDSIRKADVPAHSG